MVFTLYILRHAKSDWSTSGRSDFDRPLNKRGRKDARHIGQWMCENKHIPHLLVSSSAVRARETANLVHKEYKYEKPNQVLFEEDLYLADLDKLLEFIKRYQKDNSSVMLVAHNPGMEHLVYYLSSQEVQTGLNGRALTTANLVIFEYPDNSFNPSTEKGKLIAFIKPEELYLI